MNALAHPLEARHLRLIVAIADGGSMMAAARLLHVTQPALSRQLSELERRLGTPLFTRLHNRLQITDAGEQLLAGARRILVELEVLERQLRADDDGESTGVLRVAAECYTNYQWLPRLLVAFGERWPRVDVRIVPEATSRPSATTPSREPCAPRW